MARLSTPLTLLIAAACAACSSGSPSAAASDAGPVPVSDAPSGEVGCTNQAGLDTYADGIKKLGAAGHFEFELVSSTPAPPALDNNTFVVRVTRAGSDQPLNGELSVALDMPEHGHPSPKSPTVTFDPDAKMFTLDPMDLFMVGFWQITFSFASLSAEENGAGGSAGEGDTPSSASPDSAVFKFCIE